jgi:hypothetical protein
LTWLNFDDVILNPLIQAIVVKAEIIFLCSTKLAIHFSDYQCNRLVRGIPETERGIYGFPDYALV